MDTSEEANNGYEDLLRSSRMPTESTQLLPQTSSSNVNYLNVINNICSLVFFVEIVYFSFVRGVSLFSFHILFMGIGWILLFPSGINSFTAGDVATQWIPVRGRHKRHWIVQLLSLIFSLIGFAVIVINKTMNNSSHFVSLHAIFGLIAMILLVATSLGGVGALYGFKLGDFLAPIYVMMIHSFSGMATFALGMISIILILFSGWFRFGEVTRYVSLALSIVILLSTLLNPILKIYFRLRGRINFIRS